MLRLLGRYIFKEVLASATLGTLLATFVVFLRGLDKLFELLVQSSVSNVKTVFVLFALAIPPVLPLTIPFGVLVGILIGLGRMSADGEIVAMRASGVSSRRVIAPVLVFAGIGMLAAAAASLYLTPAAMYKSTRVINDLAASQLSAEIQPRVFVEDFPNTILYVGDVPASEAGDPVRWRPVFIADVTEPEKRQDGMKERAMGPRVYTAREAVVVSNPVQRRMLLRMHDGAQHEMGKDGVAHDAFAPVWDVQLTAAPPTERVVRSGAMKTRQLLEYKTGPDLVENKIELHRRFALPVACIMLALVGIPLGIATRKGGRSAGYVNAIFLAFFCYYLAFISLLKFARQGALPIPVAIWLPNFAFAVAGIILMRRMERPGDRDIMAVISAWFGRRWRALRSRAEGAPEKSRFAGMRIPLLPQLVDTYILSRFLVYLALLLVSLVSLTEIYTFFELMSDMVRNQVPLSTMFAYLFFLSPELIFQTLPMSVLVAVLVTFGVLSKQNEITAFKACGVSLYRLSLPILIACTVLSAGLFAFDHYYVPGANRRQEALRAEIKGKPTQTHLNPERKWIMGRGSRIYYYRIFDSAESMMGGVSVFEMDPRTFRMVRQVGAERARWSSSLKTWVFENGWYSDFNLKGERSGNFFQVMTFSGLNEEPDYFLKEAVQEKQMNFRELRSYIADLQHSGFDTIKLQVQFYRKFAVPLFALIMALLAIPFGFMVGNRGAMTGIGVSLGIAMAYWGVSTLFQKAGDVGQLPPEIAAWSPDVVFALAGLYLMLRIRT